MKNVLVIGGSYFAGRVFVEAIRSEDIYKVFVFNRGRLPLNWKGVTELVGDRNDEHQIKSAMPAEPWRVVVDFCAYTPSDVEKMLTCLPGKIDQYILISTTTVYDDTCALPITEDALKVAAPQPALGPYAEYGFNKWRAECKVAEMCEQRGIPYTILRPCIIYGRYNYAPRESYFFDRISNDEPMIVPQNRLALFSFVWVADVARIILRCIDNADVFNQTFNAAAPELISYRRLVEVLETISGKWLPVEEMSVEDINAGGIPLPFPLDSHLIYSGAAIQRKLGFEYTSFVTGMGDTYEHYRFLQEQKESARAKSSV